jgi:hypothetical protein
VPQHQSLSAAQSALSAGPALAVNAGGWMGDDYAACVATVLASA